jgi:5-hydroxyisourate hydrolase
MAGGLTTHVLDTAQGKPAAGMAVELWRLDGEFECRLLKSFRTTVDGRPEAPLLDTGEMETGVYELVFAVGDYFRTQGLTLAAPSFLDRVPVRFGIADPQAHYHVPLLVSPWAYSSYRGS